MEREPGYYWVVEKQRPHDTPDVEYWNGSRWCFDDQRGFDEDWIVKSPRLEPPK